VDDEKHLPLLCWPAHPAHPAPDWLSQQADKSVGRLASQFN
jgi:hypothetical protein